MTRAPGRGAHAPNILRWLQARLRRRSMAGVRAPGHGLPACLALALCCLAAFRLLVPGPLLAQGPPPAQDALPVYYMERAPYYVTEDGRAAGLLNDIAARVLHTAGVAATFSPLPSKRILEELARPGARACSVGWFKTPEREEFARFSRPIYRGLPLQPLARAATADRIAGRTLEGVLADPELVLGVLDGFSYGTMLDGAISRLGTRTYRFAGTQKQLARMLAAGRVDYMLLAPEEVASLLADAGVPEGALRLAPVSGSPAGSTRHLMCSRGVSLEEMRQIDAAITALGLVRDE